jgi:hypothetical protein
MEELMVRLTFFFILWTILSVFIDYKIAFKKSALALIYLHIIILFIIPIGVMSFAGDMMAIGLLFGIGFGIVFFFCVFIETVGSLAWYYSVEIYEGYSREGGWFEETRWRISLLILGGILWIIGLPETFFF